ncbi:MAG: c-type cytochrome [Gammaproteobacteria bacterium]
MRNRWSVPVGAIVSVLLAGAAGGTGQPTGYEAELRIHNLARGRVVFQQGCMTCHETGRRAAPVLGSLDAWLPRIEQPLGTLIDHAVAGHGNMPPRGGLELSDQDVAAAVAYVVHRTRVLAGAQGDLDSLPASAAGEPVASDQAIVHMFLMLIGKDRWR